MVASVPKLVALAALAAANAARGAAADCTQHTDCKACTDAEGGGVCAWQPPTGCQPGCVVMDISCYEKSGYCPVDEATCAGANDCKTCADAGCNWQSGECLSECKFGPLGAFLAECYSKDYGCPKDGNGGEMSILPEVTDILEKVDGGYAEMTAVGGMKEKQAKKSKKKSKGIKNTTKKTKAKGGKKAKAKAKKGKGKTKKAKANNKSKSKKAKSSKKSKASKKAKAKKAAKLSTAQASKPLSSGRLSQTSVCALPLETGPCRAFFRRWGFDAVASKCVEFTYGGCQGNENNFESEKECLASCSENV